MAAAQELKFHPLALAFPLMEKDEFDELKKDIDDHGLKEPIVVLKDTMEVIDGRNRALACKDLGVTPKITFWNPKEGDLIDFVISRNLRRRHLSASQRAMIATGFEQQIADEIKEQHESAKKVVSKSGNGKPKPKRDAHAEAAKKAKVSRAYVADAKKIKAASREIAEEVKAGKLTIGQAKKKAGVVKKYKLPVATTPNGQQEAAEKKGSTDQEWLEKLPLFKKLEGRPLKDFCETATLFRMADAARKMWESSVAQLEKKGRCPKGSLMKALLQGQKINPPEKWRVCPEKEGCGGTGVSSKGKECATCHGLGYVGQK